MERHDKVLAAINVSTSQLKITAIQDVLKLAKQSSNTSGQFWNQVSGIIWDHLKIGLKKFDDQLLSATCFYTVITHTDNQNLYLTELSKMIDEELLKKSNGEVSSTTYNVVSMMYGIFQSTSLKQDSQNYIDILASVLKQIFDLLLVMGYEYSQYTFISFKTIKLFKKVCGTEFQECIFNRENQIRLLNFVNHNWENPVTGIRDLNRSIFQTLISTLNDEMYETVLKEIGGFYWNKAKYLMLSEIIEHKNGKLFSLINEYKWVDGLTCSLYKPGLVSAGADMYYALLKNINFPNDWCKIFLCQVIKILNGSSSKAIENFNNFWCLTTFKKFPSISHKILDELNSLESSEQNLCSQLCIIKQANKLGIIDKSWCSTADFNHIEKAVLNGIEHCNYYIRILAFDIVCVSQKKLVPSHMEYNLILSFINNNVNSDCTVLRLSMLNSFSNFLTQLHSIFLNVMIKEESTEDLQQLLGFCKKIQNLIINSISLNGNYQRKITCVKLSNSLITSFSEIPNKKRGQTRRANITLITYVKEKGCWLLSSEDFILKLLSLLTDPTDDVRENVVKLLLNHYSEQLREQNINKYLVNDAVKSMKSKFFYEISCGQSMFKLLTNLVMEDKHCIAEYKSVEDIFYYAYNELIIEQRAKTNIMKAIETGKQLHSFINILLVVLDTCISSSYKIDLHGTMPELVNVLEIISNQFSWEEESSTSSDFSKMNDMVENIIGDSGYSLSDMTDHTKLSGLHQIVLNSLWLNVKASCDLASILVQLNDNDPIMCEKCLNIITHVLETSRHKGTIEAAGASLGRGIQYLTSLPDKNKVSEVPYILLKCKLNDLISETNKMSSITRRGAGLSIMVHRIVSSDLKKEKPLFHYFMNTLLHICYTTEDTLKTNDEKMENQIDLPKAIYIHFMTRVVSDSSLASDMMFYFTKLAELAFGNLTSPHWQIRNAALQLYGALIPKQIGKKKASGSDEETTASVACDELRTHSPKLWKYIIEQLKLSNDYDKVQAHSNLVPILNLLANSAKRYNFSYNLAEMKNTDKDLLDHLVLLLNSPIHTVRRLTAKCIFNIYEFENIYEVLLNQVHWPENLLHGSLILLNLCHNYYSLNPAYEMNFENLRNKYRGIFCSQNRSYLCKSLFEDICTNEYELEDIERTIFQMNSDRHIPGVHLWAEARLEKYVKTCSWHKIPALLNLLLQQSNYEMYCGFIFLKTKTQDCTDKEILVEVVDILLSYDKKYSSSIIWKILFEISLKTILSDHLDIPELLKNIEERESMYTLRYIIPLVARNILNTQDDNKLSLIKFIKELSDFETSDVDMRLIAAIANNELANQFDYLDDAIKVGSITCAVMLLQDEDEDVRNQSVYFYQRLSRKEATMQPYICLSNILNREFLCNVFAESQSSIQDLINELLKILKSTHTVDEYNPFANDSKNIYLEPNVLKEMVENLTNV